MDPTAVLADLRTLAAVALDPKYQQDSLAVELAEKVQALDGWLTGGGFLPAQWPVPQGLAALPF